MKKKVSFEHSFSGLAAEPSKCQVDIWSDNTCNVVLLTDINVGVSVTNACELIANGIKEHLDQPIVRFFETYPHSPQPDEIIFEVVNAKYRNPVWKFTDDFNKLIKS